MTSNYRFWVILDGKGGMQQVLLPHHPCDPPSEDAAPAYDVERSAVVEMQRAGDLAIEDPQPDGTWSLDLERYRARLLATVDSERASRVAGDARKLHAYARKGAEANELLTLSPAALAALSSADQAERFPWLSAEADARGEAIDVTAARVRDAMLASEATARRNEALAVAAKEAVRLAGNRQAADAAAVIDWEDE